MTEIVSKSWAGPVKSSVTGFSWSRLVGLSLAAFVGLFSCDGVTVVEEEAPPPPSLPSVSFSRASVAQVPDSISWKAPKDSGRGGLGCTGTNCTVRFSFAAPLGKDTAQLSLWKYGIRLGVLQVHFNSDGSTLVVGSQLSKDDLANKLFAAFGQAHPDSVAKLGPNPRARLIAFYANRLLAGDTSLAGFPASVPVGLTTDIVNAALVQAAVRSGKNWSTVASVGAGLDSAKVVSLAQDLIKAGQLQQADLGVLQQPGKVTPPVDPQAPVLTVKNAGDATVPNSSASWLVQASATPAENIDSIQVNNQRFASSKCSVWVDLGVGGNSIKVSVLAKNGKRASESFTVTRKGKANEPILSPAPGSFDRAQWVKISDTTTGATLEWTLDGTTWNLYKDSLLVAFPDTLQVRSLVQGRDPATVTAVYVIKNVEPVQFDPKPGRFAVAQTVNFRSATPGASYECSFQGGAWSGCSGRFTIQQSGMLRVRTNREGMTSAQDSAAYQIDVQAAGAPVMSLVSGLYDGDQSVSISCAVSGCQLDWSTDSSVWTPYTAAVKVDRSMRLFARSTASAGTAVTWADYAIALAPPKFEPESGTFDRPVSVNLVGARTGAMVFVSTDSSKWTAFDKTLQIASNSKVWAWDSVQGMARSRVVSAQYRILTATPRFLPNGGSFQDVQKVVVTDSTPGAVIQVSSDSSTWTEYSSAVTVDRSGRLWARATAPGMEPSKVASVDFSLTLAAPELSLASGTFTSSRKVGIKASAGAEIRYTLDGIDPTASSALYSDSVLVAATATLKAVALRTGWKTSSVATATYTITGGVAEPTFSKASGTFASAIKVGIATTTPGAAIHYTTDGTEPSATSTPYTDSITVSSSQTIKAIALKSGWAPSTVASVSYTITGSVAQPTASVASGTYTAPIWVKLSTATSGAQIRYTLDGSAPTDSSTLFADSVQVSSTKTLKAAAFKSGWATSTVASIAYTITGTVAQPTASVASGTFTAPIWVKLSTATAGAHIRYSLDGSVPKDTVAYDLFVDSVQVASSQTLRAVAFKSGWAPSSVAAIAYTITGTVAQPTSSVAAGTYTAPIWVKLSTATAGAHIRYSLDGSVPTDTAAYDLFVDSVQVASTRTFRAVAFKSGWTASTPSTFAYTITGTVATPVITPATGTYTVAQSVTITSATAGASIYYTTDGTAPTTASTLYAGAISVAASTTVRAIAVKTGWANSAGATSNLTITGTVATPVITPVTGTYTVAQSVTITSATAGASIYYTTDGTAPTTASTLYAGAISVAASTTVRAIAVKTGWANSAGATSTLTITGTVATPVITPATGTFSAAQSVTITSTTAGATIYYTTDGTAPTTASTPYEGAFSVAASTTVRAIAVKTGWANSAGATSTITISLGTVATPVIKLAAGSYAVPQSVTITCATASAQIRYTTDGTVPTAASTLYSAPIAVSATQTIMAAGFRANYTTSATVSRAYTITNFSIPWQTGIAYGSLTDSRDGQTYRTVKIGTQTWMAQALNYSAGGTLGLCPGGTQAGCDRSGRLYTWSETRGISKGYDTTLYGGSDLGVTGICPAGYHIPSIAEWSTLEAYVDLTKANSGNRLKSTAGWSIDAGTDDFGFRSVPAGGYVAGSGYYAQETANYFWSATERDYDGAFGPSTYSQSADFKTTGWNNKRRSTTLRCLAN
ncbi:MAG: chitobiase/beta-hexosaminidase C-terminal domain-containing protein [Fibrobacterota bacterium]|nr:chitobiase/beta-hexosaminidase C-terminal domain-containing protein [Fibrobacterota bacterium]QQS04225.1 MAG: chitobiase/beta-hexosaminidase C-terminal domain-containing protein [Fibrobacterota bacterium]